MLKIKDNVDLSILEKFGFKYIRKQNMIYEHYMYESKTKNDFYPMLRCIVFCNDRYISINTNEIDIIFDLIQAGFVEKG